MKDRIVRWKELHEIVGVSQVTIWRWEQQGQFPRRVRMGGKSVGWLLSEVDSWREKLATDRDS